MSIKLIEVDYEFICPVCHVEFGGTAKKPEKAREVTTPSGHALCCSEPCAQMFLAHCAMHEPRQPLA